MLKLLNPLPLTINLQQTALETYSEKYLFASVENIVAIREIACYEQFLLLHLFFKRYLLQVGKGSK